MSCRKYIMRHLKWTISRRYTRDGEAVAAVALYFIRKRFRFFFFGRLRAALKCLVSSATPMMAHRRAEKRHRMTMRTYLIGSLSRSLTLLCTEHPNKFYYLVSRYCVSRALRSHERWRIIMPKTETPKVNNNSSALTAQTQTNHGDRSVNAQCIVVRCACDGYIFICSIYINRRANDELLHFSLG